LTINLPLANVVVCACSQRLCLPIHLGLIVKERFRREAQS
jgi:hypothetical protein